MQTTNLIALRMPDGRRAFASYMDEQEKARILDWAKAHAARIEPDAAPAREVSNLIA
ncbi:MAG: hypothetical protein WDM79_15860 [Terricaulis sp.]